MINISLPLRPRLGRVELLTTLVSIAQAAGTRVLSLTALKCSAPLAEVAAYQEQIARLALRFDHTVVDTDAVLLELLRAELQNSLQPDRQQADVLTCDCGAYEELVGARAFNLRRVQDRKCLSCHSVLRVVSKPSLMANLNWEHVNDSVVSFHPQWCVLNFADFLKRQQPLHKISKSVSRVRFMEMGIRFQILWAFQLVRVARMLNEMEITLHFVHLVEAEAFYCAMLASMIEPRLRIHFRALPVVWLPNEISITAATDREIRLIQKGLKSSRQTVNVS